MHICGTRGWQWVKQNIEVSCLFCCLVTWSRGANPAPSQFFFKISDVHIVLLWGGFFLTMSYSDCQPHCVYWLVSYQPLRLIPHLKQVRALVSIQLPWQHNGFITSIRKINVLIICLSKHVAKGWDTFFQWLLHAKMRFMHVNII